MLKSMSSIAAIAFLGVLSTFPSFADDLCSNTNQPCGNTQPRPCCDPCERGETEGTVPCEGVGAMNAYAGNAARCIVDTALFNTPSGKGLTFKRSGTTRVNYNSDDFGNLGIWRHNWHWEISPLSGDRFTVNFPQGYVSWYSLDPEAQGLTNAVYAGGIVYRGRPFETEALIRDPDTGELCLLKKDGTRWFFVSYLLWGQTKYQLDRMLDPEGRQTTFYYDGARRLVRVEEPGGRDLTIAWQNISINQGEFYGGMTIAAPPSPSGWTQYGFSGISRQYWRLRAADGKRLPVAELRFLDSLGQEVGGTVIGTAPLAPGYEAANAFDGNDATYFISSDVTGGYVGLDLGSRQTIAGMKLKPVPGYEADLVGAQVESASVWPVNLPTITWVETSDGRRQNYEYTQTQDPNLPGLDYVMLTHVLYDDGTTAEYTYEQVLPNTRPLLKTARDVRDTGRLNQVEYTYHTGLNNVMGMVHQEIDPVDGDILSCLTTDDQAHKPKVVYPGGREIVYVMGSQVSKRTDSLGRETQYAHEGQWGSGYLLSKTDPRGNTTSYTRDEQGRVLSRVNPDGSVRDFSYDLLGRLIAETNELGFVTTYTRDALGRQARIDYPDGTFETFQYDPLGLVTNKRERHGGVVSYAYDAQGLRIAMTDELGYTTSYSNYPSGLVATETDARGFTTSYEYNTEGRPIRVTYADGGEEYFEYDDYGNRTVYIDAQSNVWQSVYDQFNRKVADIDPLGRQTTYSYDNLGTGCGCSGLDKPTQIISPSLKVTHFVYDSEWQLIARTDGFGTPEAATVSNAYDAAGNRIAETDANGNTTHYSYDSRNRLISVTNALGEATSYEYDEVGNRLSETAPDGGETTYAYDAMNRLVITSNALGHAVVQSYNALGRLESVTDARGNATSFEYNARNERIKTINPDLTFTEAAYDAVGNLIARTDELGNTSSNVYDHAGRMIASVDPLGRTTQYAYPVGKRGAQLAVIRASGRITEYAYDAAWQRVAQIEAPGTAEEAVTQWTYDLDGNATVMTDPLGHAAVSFYNALNRRVAVSNALGYVTAYFYDPAGNLLLTLRPDGTGTTNAYDAVDRLVSVTDAKGETIQYGYDAVGRMTSMTDANGNVTQWDYDLLGRLTTKTYDDDTEVAYTYDENGNLATATWANGVVRTYTYDARNRLTAIDYSDATPAVSFAYDDAGRMTGKSSSAASFVYAYDDAGQLTGETQTLAGHPAGALSIAYGYNVDGNRASVTYPHGQAVTYGYTGRSQLASVTKAGPPPVMSYQYDLAGRVVLKGRENGTFTDLGYDAVNQLLAAVHHDPVPAVLDSVEYGYDSVGRRFYAKYADDIGDRFGYDAIDQVVDVQYDVVDPDTSPGPGASYEESEYDPMGNRLEFDDNGSVDIYEPNNLNQYAEIDDVALSYDLNGNLTEDNSGKVSTWDGENRMLSVQPDSPTNGDIRVEYTYDAGSRRVKAVDYARVRGLWSVVRSRFFIYDAWNVLEEHHYDGADQLIGARYYTWGSDLSGSMQGAGGIGGLLMTEDTVGTNAVYYHHYDGNGNVILLSDHTGTASASYRYAAFGSTRYAAGPHAALNPYRFSTKPVEEATGLYYYGQRYYKPEMGRWTRRDPLGDDAFLQRYLARKKGAERNRLKAESLAHQYLFCGNSPVSALDLLGLLTFEGCSKLEESEIESHLKRMCGAIESSTFSGCLCHKELLGCLKTKCEARDTHFTCLHPGDADYARDCLDGAACAKGSVGGNWVVICYPQFRPSSGSRCSDERCTLADELSHNCGKSHEGKGNLPRKALECCNRVVSGL